MTDKTSKVRIKGLEAEAVQAYLSQYPFLKTVLHEAEERVIEFFGGESEIVYRLVHDPEIANHLTLFGDIWLDLTVDEAFDRFKEFDYQWYLLLPQEIRNVLEFQIRPRRV